ncbi:MAG: hypothetical protein QFX31_06720 [Methanothrix sp.]|uniref:hypothetical protein n=1 Tax=Methanothrix sp. TaxID=90426 RepID=UPI0032AFC448|nr:hypothetical protein [Methanothrix sp.]
MRVRLTWGISLKVTYTDKSGKKVEQTFSTEEEGKKLKEKFKALGITDAKWEW